MSGPRSSRIDALIGGFVAEQLRPWGAATFEEAALAEHFRRLNARPSICLFRVRGSTVTLLDKDPGQPSFPPYVSRFHCYWRHLMEVFEAVPMPRSVLLAIDIQDIAPDHDGLPVFSFQKLSGQRNLLLPDIDLIGIDYLETVPPDDIAYADKATVATFSGSTTGGGLITAEAVREARFPRLRAARSFAGRPEVDFRLTAVVQCDPEAAALLQAEGFGTGPLGWDFTYRGKFALSLDGNGASCSRPAIILKSNCVLMKYRSDCRLHYSSGLVDGRNMLEITCDEQVVEIVRAERDAPGRYASVAAAGTRFAEDVLCKASALAYSRALIDGFVARLR